MNRVDYYKQYHLAMMNIGDNDPTYPALEYIADRFELNIEQRAWMAFLFQATYCSPVVYYILSEFPDYNMVDVRRLQKWWDSNKNRLLFQTDRAKVKNFDKFVPMFVSYRNKVGNSQMKFFEKVIDKMDIFTAYNHLYKECGQIYYVGRFSLFLWLESIQRLTNLLIYPTGLDLPNATSCRNGLCYVLGHDDWVEQKLEKTQYNYLEKELNNLVKIMVNEYDLPIDYYNVETSLCSFKKLHWKTRYLGYYIDRQQEEICIMEKNVPEGVCWDVLWDFRKEYFNPHWLGELNNWYGIRKDQMGLPSQKLLLKALNQSYKKRVEFKGLEEVYDHGKKIEY